jgi:hypothetical protein
MATPFKLYVAAEQQKMLREFNTTGYTGLAREVKDLEVSHSPNIFHSRIVDQTQFMPHATLLLSQLSLPFIRSLLQNTLIEDIKSRRIPVDPQRFTIHYSRNFTDQVACGIYVNYLLDPRGHGLTVDEYEEFVDGMICCIENRIMQSPRLGPCDIDQAATRYFRNFTGRTTSEIPAMRKSCAKPANLQYFKTTQAALIAAARAQSATEIRLAGEAGFSIDVHDRCCDHEELKGSANFFRLARCVLNALWPQRNFILHSVYLFQAFNFEHVEYGEGVATHLVGGYPAYGGFNYTQAGMQVQSAKTLGHKKWILMAVKNQGTGVTMEANIQRQFNTFTAGIARLEVSAEIATSPFVKPCHTAAMEMHSSFEKQGESTESRETHGSLCICLSSGESCAF